MSFAAKADVPALTGVRGVAALLVACYHYFLPVLPYGSTGHQLLGRGYLYVDLFFVLSGYVMALNYGWLFAGGVRLTSVAAFLWKRFARIYPLYACVLAAMTLGYWLVHGDFVRHEGWIVVAMADPRVEIPLNVALVQSWGFAEAVVGQAWSVSTEVAAYLVFPWLAYLVLRRPAAHPVRTLVILLAAMCLPVISTWLAAGDGQYHIGTLDIWNGPPALLRCLGGFLIGMILHHLASWASVCIAFTDMFGFAVIAVYVALLLAEAPDLVLYPALPLLVLCLAGNQGWMGKMFGSPPVYVLGLLSYAFYLVHVYFIPATNWFERVLAGTVPETLAYPIATLSGATALLGVSAAAYLCVEKPARRLISRIGSLGGRADRGRVTGDHTLGDANPTAMAVATSCHLLPAGRLPGERLPCAWPHSVR